MTKLVDKMLDTEESEKHLRTEKIEKLGKPVQGFDEMFEHARTFSRKPL